MATTAEPHLALGDAAARQLANAQKTAPTMLSISPRWLVHLLPWVGVEAGIYRLNKVKDESRVLTACSQREDERPSASWDPASVTKGGPFDLGELERLANQMFTALPGALLPGLDPGQLESVALPPEAESQRPPPEALASPDGHLTVAEPARETLAPGLEAAARNGAAGLMPAAANLTAAQDLSNLADLPQLDPNGPAALRPSIGGGLFELSGDPMPLSELGLAGLPRGMVEDP